MVPMCRGERGMPDHEALEVGQSLPIFSSITRRPHLNLHLAVAGLGLLDREPQRAETACLPSGARPRSWADARICRAMAGSAGTIRAGSPATAAAALRGAENADGRLHFGIVQHVVGRRERRDAVQGEMHLQVAARWIRRTARGHRPAARSVHQRIVTSGATAR